MYYLYILKNELGQYYVGQTNNLNRRLHDHKANAGALFIRYNGIFKLVYTEEFIRRNDAMRREKQIKHWSILKKEALISGNFEDLIKLSRNRQK